MCCRGETGQFNGAHCKGNPNRFFPFDFYNFSISIHFRSQRMQFGEDEWADKYDEHLKKFAVCSKFIDRVAGKNTGLAQINVAENGENQIVIIPGANDSLSPSDVENAAEVLDSSKVIGK